VHVRAVDQQLFEFADPGSDFVIQFVAVEINGKPQCIEHSAIQWLPLQELPGLPLAPSDRRFVEFLMAQPTRDAE
jgi:hypothetical protein